MELDEATDPTKNLVERLLSGKPTPLEREAGEALASLADELRLAREELAFYKKCAEQGVVSHFYPKPR